MTSQSDQIRELFRSSTKFVSIIAPFIKMGAFKFLIEVIPKSVYVRCVTRWLPEDVASGVSDPEIIYLLEERGNFSISLVDTLHAKLYIADDRCLAGSANVTHYGLGAMQGASNIEILVETTLNDPNVIGTLEAISLVERPASLLEAEKARRLAGSHKSIKVQPDAFWFPKSRRSDRAYEFYCAPPKAYLSASDQILLDDIIQANLKAGLDEEGFRIAIRKLLAEIPLAESLLSSDKDMLLTRADAFSYITLTSGSEFTKHDLWLSFVSWMSCFFSDILITQNITEVALRRAQVL